MIEESDMNRLLLLLKLIPMIVKMKYWSIICTNPAKKSICTSIYELEAMTYNVVKYRWMPQLGKDRN